MPHNKKPAFTTTQAKKMLADAAKKAPLAVQEQLDIKLSPYQAHSNTYLHSSNNSIGTYHRSGKHEQLKSKEIKKFAENTIYTKHKPLLSRDKRAHAGAYNNNFQRLGDAGWNTTKKAANTSPGNSSLYNHLIHYRQSTCEHIASQLTELKHLKVSYYHEYPCLMIHIEKSATLTEPRKPTDGALEAWTGFLMNYFIGAMNANTYKSGLSIEMVRRASFGFLSPTVAPTDQSIRLNTGIIPAAYQALIVTTLKEMDDMLGKLKTEIADNLPLPNNHFFKSDAFKNYHQPKEPANDKATDTNTAIEPNDNKPIDHISGVTNLFQLLWTPVDKNGQTTTQNIMRTAHAQSGIQKIVFESLALQKDNPAEAMRKAIDWATRQFTITKKSLSFSQEEDVTFSIPLTQGKNIDINDDPFFWACIKHIHENLGHLPNPIAALKATLNDTEIAIHEKNLFQLYAKLEAMDDAIMIQAGYTSTLLEPEDGFGSDSETEANIDGATIYASKIIVANGMRAIICALIAASLEKKSVDVFLDKAYYEVPDGLKLLETLNGLPVNMVSKPSEGNITLTDATPCITDNKPLKKTPRLKPKEKEYLNNAAIIVDTTSASIERQHEEIKAFTKSRSPLLCFAASGTKQEQLGSDANSYGTIRLFSKQKSTIDTALRKIREIEEKNAICSPISHQHRRLMKKANATPTNAAILKLK